MSEQKKRPAVLRSPARILALLAEPDAHLIYNKGVGSLRLYLAHPPRVFIVAYDSYLQLPPLHAEQLRHTPTAASWGTKYTLHVGNG